MSQIFRQNAGKKIKSIFEVFIQQKIEFKFVLFSIGQTLQTPPIAEILCFKNLRAFVVCGFLIKYFFLNMLKV